MELDESIRLFENVDRATERARNALDSLGKDGGPDYRDPFFVDAREALREAAKDLSHAADALSWYVA